MEPYYVILFGMVVGGRVYRYPSDYFFKTKEDAGKYAQQFVEKSAYFSNYEIKKVIPYYE